MSARGPAGDLGRHQEEGTDREIRQQGSAVAARQAAAARAGHDFPGPEVPRAYPYGVYDIGRNAGFVNVGTDHDTGTFAVASIRGWWRAEGRGLYTKANKVEHRLFSFISSNWRGEPLRDYETIVHLFLRSVDQSGVPARY